MRKENCGKPGLERDQVIVVEYEAKVVGGVRLSFVFQQAAVIDRMTDEKRRKILEYIIL